MDGQGGPLGLSNRESYMLGILFSYFRAKLKKYENYLLILKYLANQLHSTTESYHLPFYAMCGLLHRSIVEEEKPAWLIFPDGDQIDSLFPHSLS